MKVDQQRVISLTYELRDPDRNDELLERMDANYPFVFLFGTGKLLRAFEAHLQGLEAGDRFDFILTPEEAYGTIESQNIIQIDLKTLQLESTMTPASLEPGQYINLTDDQGTPHHGKILDRNEQSIQVDFNHAMAGKRLHFIGTVLHVRPASIDELVRQHYIQDDGIHQDPPENG